MIPPIAKKRTVIGIVGPTGAGKTTLAKRLGEQLSCPVHFEEPADNPYLKRFYHELTQDQPSEVALKSQLHFLLASHRQAQAIHQHQDTIIWDVPLYGHKMYADLLHESGKMPAADYELYCQIYQNCIESIPTPDVMVVVSSPVKKLMRQIKSRGREMELATPAEYWQRQIEYWDKADRHLPKVPVLKFSSADLDWRRPPGLATVLSTLQESLTQPLALNFAYAS